MKYFLPVIFTLLFFASCDGDAPNTAAKPPVAQQKTALQSNTSGVGLTLKWPQPDFKVQKIPETATQVQIEITEVGTFQNLYRTTIGRDEVPGDQTSRQIRVDMQGKVEREVLVLVTAKNANNGVVAKGEKTIVLKAGVRSALQLEVVEGKS